MTSVTVTPTLALAGFPFGEVRTVERTDMVASLLEQGLLEEAEEPPAAPVEAEEPPVGGFGAVGGFEGSVGGSGPPEDSPVG